MKNFLNKPATIDQGIVRGPSAWGFEGSTPPLPPSEILKLA